MAEKAPLEPTYTLNAETTPILFTDNIMMQVNEFGIVLDIAQRIGSTNQAQIVSRIGMSREHAKQFAAELSRVLAITQETSAKDTPNN